MDLRCWRALASCGAILLALSISGCDSESMEGSPTATVVRPQAPQMTPQTSRVTEQAPSYEEIRQKLFSIIYTKDRPNGPKVGADGIEDQAFLDEYYGYVGTIQGKRIENWHGWFRGYTDVSEDFG